MTFKKYLAISVFALLSFGLSAQSIDNAYKLLTYGKTHEAVDEMTKLTNAAPTNLENQLVLYNILRSADKFGPAKDILTGIINADENGPYGRVAAIIARIDAGENVDDMTSDIDKAVRKGKKARGILTRSIGEYFLYGNKKNAVHAIKFIKQSIDEYGLKNYATRMLLADAYNLKNEAGNAVTNYEYALELDPSSAVPAYKIGTTYIRAKNYEFGVPELRRAIEIDPGYANSYRDLGKYYYDATRYPEAKESYGKYMSMVTPSLEEKVQYGNILYLNKDYDEAITIMKEVKKQDAKRNYINRLLGYSYYETGKYNEALSSMDFFFNNQDTTRVLASDYEYLGKIQFKLGEDSLGRTNYLQAFLLDSTKTDLIKDIADTLFTQKKYAEAGNYYMVIANSTNLASDYFYATRADYLGGNYLRGDTAALGIISKLPEDIQGYLWRARHNAQMDTAKAGLALPFYEKVIEYGEKDLDKYRRELSEAANWITVHYIHKEEYARAEEFNNKALDFDASNEQTLNLLDFLVQVSKQD